MTPTRVTTEPQPWERLVEAEAESLRRRMEVYAAGAEPQLALAFASGVTGRGAALRCLRDAPVELVTALLRLPLSRPRARR